MHYMGLHLESEVEKQLRGIAEYAPLLVAVSGGVDSVVLAEVLHALGKNIGVVHCNFQLRGAAADEDEALVAALAEKLQVRMHHRGFATEAYAAEKGISLQMAARDLRYGYFEELMQQVGYHYLCTAHHLDDSLETLLLNFSRGTGLAGLTRIGNRQQILRPLQEVSKGDVYRYARKHELQWREDASNAKTDYRRNAIRHFVLTSWRKAERYLDQGARRSFQNLQSEQKALDYFLQCTLEEHLEQEEGRQRFPFDELRSKPYFEALLHFWLRPYGPFDYAALYRLEIGHGQQFDNADYRLLYHQGQLILERQAVGKLAPVAIEEDTRELVQPLYMRFEKLTEMRPSSIFKEGIAQLDFDKLHFPLTLRPWEPGDAFVPLGMNGRKKLSDFFTDRKVDRLQRERTLVLCSGEEIVWVVGMRIADPYKVTQTTKNIYFVHVF